MEQAPGLGRVCAQLATYFCHRFFAISLCLRLSPPVFPDNELEVSVPSAHAMIQRCRRIWIAARQVLIRQGDRVKRAADRRRRPAPDYQPGQRVWLSAKDLRLKVPSKKLAPRFVGPFPVTRKIGPAAVRLRLPRSLRVHPTFHVSQVKPVRESPMVPATTARSDRRGPGLQGQAAIGGTQPGPGQAVPGRLGGLRTQGAPMGAVPAHHGP